MMGRLLALLLVAACVVALSPRSAESRGGPLSFAISGSPDTLDPQRTSATLAFQVMKSLYDTLRRARSRCCDGSARSAGDVV